MNRIMILLAVAIMIVSAVLVVVPSNAAASSSTITANNAYGNLQSRFTVNGALFYGVYTTANSAVIISIQNRSTGNIVATTSITEPSSGAYQSWVSSNFNFFDLTGYSLGSYVMNASINGAVVASTTFSVFNPVYTTSVEFTLSNFSTPNQYFIDSGYIYAHTKSVDQFGNPMSGNTSAGLQLFFTMGMSGSGNTFNLGTYSPDDFGIVLISFPAYYGFSGYGAYNLTAYFAGTPSGSTLNNPQTGNSTYFIMSNQITISPPSTNNVYGQGLLLKFYGQFEPYNGYVNATITSLSTGQRYFDLTQSRVYSGNWNASYYVNYSVPDGHYIFNVTETSNGYLFYSNVISFQAISIQAYPNQFNYLPGEPAVIDYTITNTSNNAPASNVSVTYTLNYTTSNGKQSESGVVTGGVLNVIIPVTAQFRSKVTVTLNAIDSFGHTASTTVVVGVNDLASYVYTGASAYYPGEPITVYVGAFVSPFRAFPSSPVTGALVYANISFQGTVLGSFSQRGLTTDGNGQASFVLLFPGNATLGTYSINVSVSAYGWQSLAETTFELVKQTAQYSLVLVPSEEAYVSGSDFSATWELVSNGTALTGASASYSATINNGAITAGTSSNGLIKFQIPAGDYGTMTLSVLAGDVNGNSASAVINVPVVEAMLVINTGGTFYLPSQTVQVSYYIVGNGFNAPEYYYTVTDGNGYTVLSGSTLKTSFTFKVPKVPAGSYTITVVAANGSSGRTITSSDAIFLQSGFQIFFSLSSSSYVTDTYTQGSTITIYYRIDTYQQSSASPTYTLQISILGVPDSSVTLTVASSQGSIRYNVPSSIGNGNYIISVTAIDDNGLISSALQNMAISNAQPVWNYNVIGGVSLGSVLWGLITLIALGVAFMAYTGRKMHPRDLGRSGKKEETEKKNDSPQDSGKQEQK
ncbi:MAG: hypothetical protein M1351_02820 [Candidatus Thermoplasmatota archaeon]|nr:hypothetical protein [Candidatus Sysuiplasma jiujiangense]MCL5253006.1 hypothetical protein [Candidatus Thermoplasmatota archaeon]